MQPVLFDSSIYITALRTGDEAALALRRLAANSPVWLSSVVLEELYAGVALGRRHVLERLERDFDNARRMLVPNLHDWTQTGKVLARLAAKYNYEQIGQGRLTNDALIAMSAGRFFRADSIGRRFPYAQAGQYVTFTPFVHRGQLQARDVTPIEPMPVIDLRHHREISTVVFLSDDSCSGFVERVDGDRLLFRIPTTLSTQLTVGSTVGHGIYCDATNRFRATRLKLVSAPELSWPLENVRPLRSI